MLLEQLVDLLLVLACCAGVVWIALHPRRLRGLVSRGYARLVLHPWLLPQPIRTLLFVWHGRRAYRLLKRED
jgi:hypothetical protein